MYHSKHTDKFICLLTKHEGIENKANNDNCHPVPFHSIPSVYRYVDCQLCSKSFACFLSVCSSHPLTNVVKRMSHCIFGAARRKDKNETIEVFRAIDLCSFYLLLLALLIFCVVSYSELNVCILSKQSKTKKKKERKHISCVDCLSHCFGGLALFCSWIAKIHLGVVLKIRFCAQNSCLSILRYSL